MVVSVDLLPLLRRLRKSPSFLFGICELLGTIDTEQLRLATQIISFKAPTAFETIRIGCRWTY
jgi:hypothetical protein